GNPSKKKWILQTSQHASMQYFVGEFDGVRFVNENTTGKILRPDYGPEYYAGITYNQLPAAQSATVIGWVNNWNYANDIPTTPWKGAMSLPRTMRVKEVNGGWILLQQPVAAIKQLRQPELVQLKNKMIDNSITLTEKTTQCEIDLLIEPGRDGACGLLLAAGNQHAFEIGYDVAKSELYIDRSHTANQAFNKNFKKLSRYATTLALKNKTLRLHVFFDNSIVEVFANDGEAVLTAQFFPAKNENEIRVFSNGSKSRLISLDLWPVKSAW
ncbi:MAG: GH32 C-terminal domain-containing protein, partial [Chitinophagaceae bacterium]